MTEYCYGHPGYDEDVRGNCKFCGKPRRTNSEKPLFQEYIDPFELAKLLREREEQKSREWIPRINNCPYCQIKALSYNLVMNTFECLNIKCTKYHVQIQSMTVEYSFVITYVKTQNQ